MSDNKDFNSLIQFLGDTAGGSQIPAQQGSYQQQGTIDPNMPGSGGYQSRPMPSQQPGGPMPQQMAPQGGSMAQSMPPQAVYSKLSFIFESLMFDNLYKITCNF